MSDDNRAPWPKPEDRNVTREVLPPEPAAEPAALDLDAIEALAAAATLGPWAVLPGSALVCVGPDPHGGAAVAECEDPDHCQGSDVAIYRGTYEPNATFIAAARAAVPAMAARLRATEAAARDVLELLRRVSLTVDERPRVQRLAEALGKEVP